jgi:hypothetical protein
MNLFLNVPESTLEYPLLLDRVVRREGRSSTTPRRLGGPAETGEHEDLHTALEK